VKTLVAGRFSFDEGRAAASDRLVGEVARDWIEEAGCRCDLATPGPGGGGLEWREVEPGAYSRLVLVACHQPEGRPGEEQLLARFAGRTVITLNLERAVTDAGRGPAGPATGRDGSAALGADDRTPVAGRAPLVSLCTAGLGGGAVAAILRLLTSRGAAVVEVDARPVADATGLRTRAEAEPLLARADLVVTTRMLGTALALRHGVPVVAIDPDAGGARIVRLAGVVGWPVVLTADALSDETLRAAFDDCLTGEARAEARGCRERADALLRALRDVFPEASPRPPAGTPPVDLRGIAPAYPEGTGVASHSRGEPHTGHRPTAPARRVLKTLRRAWGAFAVASPLPRSVTPVSRAWGYDRGNPVDRYYIENFLGRHAGDVRGCVLEVGDASYTKRFGGDRVARAEVLDVSEGNPDATYVADLSDAGHLPSDRFDCIIFTQTLHLIYDVPEAVRTLRRVLKPGGVLLATFPGITKISHREWGGSWYWAFSGNSARRLFGEVFTPAGVTVECFGNVLTASAFLYGFAHEELRRAELDYRDPEYEVIITARAEKLKEPA